MGAIKEAFACYLEDLWNPVNNRLSLLDRSKQKPAVVNPIRPEKPIEQDLAVIDAASETYMEG